MEQDRIDKIEKLLRKAERAGTQEEAETFFAKAQELMSKWAIDEAMLDLERGEKREEPTVARIVVNKSGFWKSNCRLIFLIAKACGVEAIREEGMSKRNINPNLDPERIANLTKPKMILVGFPSDITRVEMLYASMRLQITRMANKEIPTELKGNARDAFVWRRSFLDAFADRIYYRLDEVNRLAKEEKVEEYGGSLLPALASREVVIKEKVQKMYPDLKPIKRRGQRVDYHGADRGRAAADRADIGNKPVSSTKGELR